VARQLRAVIDRERGLVLAFAAQVDAVLAAWIAGACRFPNGMVDRIVPATAPAKRLL